MSLCLYPLSPLDRYQPSGCSVTPDPIFLKTVSLSTPRLCHSISVHLAVSLHPRAPNHHYSFMASRVRSTVTAAPMTRRLLVSARFPTSGSVSLGHARAPVRRLFLGSRRPRMRTGNAHLCRSPVRCASSRTKLTVGELPGATSRRGPCQSCVSGP